MSNTPTYLIAGFVVGLGLIWVYAVALWIEGRKLTRRERNGGGES
ncbi:MAG TPA: hypothetical protein VIL86_08845 [Tepidisphaeraceae bacterium]|jgi:hypothetical protein